MRNRPKRGRTRHCPKHRRNEARRENPGRHLARDCHPMVRRKTPTVEHLRRPPPKPLSRFWISARGFWGESGEKIAWIASIGLLLLIVFFVAVQYGINVWNRKIFDAIEKRDSASVLWLSGVFFPLALASVTLGVAQVYARMGIQRRWRAWLTNKVVSRWLNHGRYYQLNLVTGDHNNPEARIAEDLRIATDAPVDFVAGVTSALLSAATFIVVLWTIGGALNASFAGTTITIPGFLVIAAIAYAGLASSAMAVIGRRFVAISESRNQAEAEFRY